MYLKKEKHIIFSIEEVEKQKNLIYHNGRKYTLKQWYFNTSNFYKSGNNEVLLKNSKIKLPKSYLGKMYQLNAQKHTYTGLILPCVVFLLISLMITYIQFRPQNSVIIKLLEINKVSIIFLDFLGILFFLIGLGILYKLLIKKIKLVYTNVRGDEGYKHISKRIYLETLKGLEINNYIYFKPLDTKRLTIREIEESDLQDYFYFASSEIVHKHLSSKPITSVEEAIKTIKTVRMQYADKLIYRLAIINRLDNKLIGYIGLSKLDLTLTSCQIIYAIHQDFWGKGFVGEALVAFVKYLKSIGKTLIIAGHVDDNINSGKVLLKNGFIRDPGRDTQMIIHDELKNIISYTFGERKEKK